MDVPRPAVFRAIDGHDVEGLRRLVAGNPAVAGARDPAGLSALRAARYRGATDLVAILLAAGPPLDLFDAAAVGDLARLGALLAADPDLVNARSNDGWTALHLAVFFDEPAAASLLVEAGSDLHARADGFGAPMPLHSAAAGNSLDSVRLLLAAGARPNEAQAGGWRPIHSAAQNGNPAMVGALRAHGAAPAVVNDTGRTPADLASGEAAAGVRAALG
ncbi:MAG: ankyrin repeat domain-containing protein [Chloroflexi bacterium]|nr:ankyrin repeat domain-containing protein [Chloroflexota bacterium]